MGQTGRPFGYSRTSAVACPVTREWPIRVRKGGVTLPAGLAGHAVSLAFDLSCPAGGYLSIVLLIGLAGGIVMGSVAAARRTQSSYPRFLASTNPSDLTISRSSSRQSDNATGAYSMAGQWFWLGAGQGSRR